MKAVVYTRYGPPEVLQLRDVRKPVPGDHEVLIRVRATTVSAGDYRIRGFRVPAAFWLPTRLALGIRGPRKTILGAEVAGEIEAVGKEVTAFSPGDQVFGIDGTVLGGYAEYVCRGEKSALAIKPANLTYEEAAAIPHGAMSALYFLREKGNIQRGEKTLIYGASGAVGTSAVQLARHFGARVTAVCSTPNVEMVRSLGADRVIDYTREDFKGSGEVYDLIFDTVGKTSFASCRGLLKEKGRYLLTNFSLPQLFLMLGTSLTGGRKVLCGVATEKKEDLDFLRDLVEAGELKPVIDRRYRLEEITEAHTYAEKGHKKGNVVVTVGV